MAFLTGKCLIGGEHCVGVRLVIRAKKARSALRGGQGSVPQKPRPKEGVVATIKVKGIVVMLGWRKISNNREVGRADVLLIGSVRTRILTSVSSNWKT